MVGGTCGGVGGVALGRVGRPMGRTYSCTGRGGVTGWGDPWGGPTRGGEGWGSDGATHGADLLIVRRIEDGQRHIELNDLRIELGRTA